MVELKFMYTILLLLSICYVFAEIVENSIGEHNKAIGEDKIGAQNEESTNKEYRKKYGSCFEKYNISYSMWSRVLETWHVNESEACVVKCLLQKDGFINEEGDVDVEFAKNHQTIGNYDPMLKWIRRGSVEPCHSRLKDADDPRSCESIFEFRKCLHFSLIYTLNLVPAKNYKDADIDYFGIN